MSNPNFPNEDPMKNSAEYMKEIEEYKKSFEND